jgi:hypothetical protein
MIPARFAAKQDMGPKKDRLPFHSINPPNFTIHTTMDITSTSILPNDTTANKLGYKLDPVTVACKIGFRPVHSRNSWRMVSQQFLAFVCRICTRSEYWSTPHHEVMQMFYKFIINSSLYLHCNFSPTAKSLVSALRTC